MGKKKFEKNKGVTFKLVFRSEDEQANSSQTLSERIFSVIEADKKKADKTNDKERQKILSQFTKEDLGQAPVKKPSTKSLAADATAPPRDASSSHAKGRDDLWITHLMRMKEQAKAEAEAEEAEEEEIRIAKEKLKKQQAAKKTPAKKGDEEEEEWESCEEEDEEWEDEDEEEEEEEEIEEEEEEEEEEDVKLFKKKADNVEEEGKKNILEAVDNKAPKLVIKEDDFPELGTEGPSMPHEEVNVPQKSQKTQHQVVEELAEEEIDLKKVHVKGAVRMKRYDDLGLPMDGYNYYQHIADPNSGGVPSFSFNAQYDKTQLLPEDVDIKKEKMNPEEREVYEALEYEGEGKVYDEIEDDFFEMLTKKEEVVVEEGTSPEKQDGKKKVTFGDNEIKEILTTKDEPKRAPGGKDPILSRKDFQKVLKQHVETLKEKYKEERIKNRAKYGMPQESSEEEEEEEEVEEGDWSEDEESRPKGYVERLKYEEDVAAQECVAKSMSDLDSDFEEEYRRSKADKQLKQASTRAASERAVPVRHAKLNIVKEDGNKAKPKDEKSTEDKEGSGDDKEEEEEEEEEEEDMKNKVEEVFKKREKGETKEEKKQRKALIKQFKQERKEKKKKFKENFDNKKKEQISVAHRQTSNLQGLSIYKLTV